jgi:hypothetical protein
MFSHDVITKINFFAAGLLALQGVILYIIMLHKDQKVHHQAFMLFWAAANIVNFFDWLTTNLTARLPLWTDLTMDTIENFLFVFAAYCLFRREDFSWRETNLYIGYALLAGAVLLVIMLGVNISDESVFWKLFYVSPNMLMSAAAFLAIGIAFFLEPVTRELRWPLLIIFCIYAVLQFPIYVRFATVGRFTVADLGAAAGPFTDAEVQTLRMFLAVGKIALLVAFTAAALSFVGYKAAIVVKQMRLSTWIFSLGFSIFTMLYRVFSALR